MNIVTDGHVAKHYRIHAWLKWAIAEICTPKRCTKLHVNNHVFQATDVSMSHMHRVKVAGEDSPSCQPVLPGLKIVIAVRGLMDT